MWLPICCALALAQDPSTAAEPEAADRAPEAADRSSAAADRSSADARRAARLERDREHLRSVIERRDALPFADEWLLEVELFFDPPSEPWFATSDAYLPRKPLAYELAWGRPAEGRERPFHADLEAPGHPYPCIVDFARQLDEHGVELLVVPVPTRLQVYPELILPDPEEVEPPFPGLAPGTGEFLLALSEAGIEVVDLLTPLAESRWGLDPKGRTDQAFLKYNMHWTPRAAQAAACVVFDSLRELDGFELGDLREGHDFVLSGQTLPWAPAASRRVPPDTEPEELHFVRILAPAGHEVRVEDPRSPILLMGDSYVTHFSLENASFAEHLWRLTRQRLDVVAIQGSGSLQTRAGLARRGKGESPLDKRIVVWLFSVVSLVDAREWRAIEMPDPSR